MRIEMFQVRSLLTLLFLKKILKRRSEEYQCTINHPIVERSK